MIPLGWSVNRRRTAYSLIARMTGLADRKTCLTMSCAFDGDTFPLGNAQLFRTPSPRGQLLIPNQKLPITFSRGNALIWNDFVQLFTIEELSLTGESPKSGTQAKHPFGREGTLRCVSRHGLLRQPVWQDLRPAAIRRPNRRSTGPGPGRRRQSYLTEIFLLARSWDLRVTCCIARQIQASVTDPGVLIRKASAVSCRTRLQDRQPILDSLTDLTRETRRCGPEALSYSSPQRPDLRPAATHRQSRLCTVAPREPGRRPWSTETSSPAQQSARPETSSIARKTRASADLSGSPHGPLPLPTYLHPRSAPGRARVFSCVSRALRTTLP